MIDYLTVLALIIGMIICGGYILSSLFKKPEPKLLINEYINMKSGEDIINILDNRIEDVLNTYVIMNLAYKDTLYISVEMQDKIYDIILENIIKSLPDTYIRVLSLLYKEPYVEIGRRTQLKLMNYVIETNGKYQE